MRGFVKIKCRSLSEPDTHYVRPEEVAAISEHGCTTILLRAGGSISLVGWSATEIYETLFGDGK